MDRSAEAASTSTTTAEAMGLHEARDAEGQESEGGHPPERRPRSSNAGRNALVEWVLIVVVALVAALLVKTFAVQAFFIPSQSMEPTLQPNDRVLVDKLANDFGAVGTGDIIVFRRPPSDTSPIGDLIKRVIAGPGQSIYVANCKVYVNGKELSQPYLPKGWEDASSEYCTVWDAPGMLDLPDPYTVPAGHYFVMGDNRKDSDDSRYWGPVPASYIVGEAFVRMWPPSRLGWL
ncbi:MAG TPA: signal peptidase I [Acidimicrobiales bacterium]|nr:signal peptidase I [Acidimicrobiales bacterium]